VQAEKEDTTVKRSTLAILLLCGILGGIVGCHHDGDDQNDPHKKRALNLPKEPGKRPQGMTALIAKTGATPFSKQDVIDYFKTHNLPRNSGATNQFTVQSLEFITSAEVTKRLEGVTTGLSDNDRVGFVTLVGTFVFTGPPKSKPVIFHQAYAVFDAVSGNLLMVGTLGQQVEQKPGNSR
jgi:hypothetical protein